MRIRSALLGLGLLLLAADARALSVDDLLAFPLPAVAGAPDLSDPELFEQLAKGVGYDYEITRVGVHNPSGNDPDPADPATWTVLTYIGAVTYLPLYDGEYVNSYENCYGEPAPVDLLLVLTSLREGHYTPGDALPPLLLGGYVESTLADDAYFFVRDPLDSGESQGVVTDEEGETFLALRFSLTPGEAHAFQFQVALRQTLDDTLFHFNRGFLASPTPVPEPGTLASLGAALALLSALRRARQK